MKHDAIARGRRLRLGGWALCLTVLALTALVLLNALVGALDERYNLALDLTGGQLTVLSDTSRALVESLDQDITITLFAQAGETDDARMLLERLIANYAAAGAHVRAQVIDPVADPAAVRRLLGANAQVTSGSAVVANADATRVRTVDALDWYGYTLDADSGAYERSDFRGEALLTAAIGYVATDAGSRVWFLTGHDEVASEYMTEWMRRLRMANYTVNQTGLLDSLPATEDVLVVAAPAIDLTDAEKTALCDWLDRGGRLLFLADPACDKARMPNFFAVLDRYALALTDGIITEDARAAGHYLGDASCLIPNIADAPAILGDLSEGTRLLLPNCRGVSGADAQALLTTSSDARCDDNVATYALALYQEAASGARLMLVGSVYAAVDSDYLNASGNLDFMMRLVNTLAERGDEAVLPAKSIGAGGMTLPNEAVRILLLGWAVVLMPGLAAAAGIWMKKRRARL